MIAWGSIWFQGACLSHLSIRCLAQAVFYFWNVVFVLNYFPALNPPSMMNSVPVTNADSSLAR